MKLPTLDKFYDQLEDHDWTFEYSDDYSVWKRGIKQLEAIQDVVKQGGEKYKKLFEVWGDYAWGRSNERPKKEETK